MQVVNYFPNQASPNFLPYAASFDSSKNLTPSIINLHNKISNPIKILIWYAVMDNKESKNQHFIYNDELFLNFNNTTPLTKGEVINQMISNDSTGNTNIISSMDRINFEDNEENQYIQDKIRDNIFDRDTPTNGMQISIINKMEVSIDDKIVGGEIDLLNNINTVYESIESI